LLNLLNLVKGKKSIKFTFLFYVCFFVFVFYLHSMHNASLVSIWITRDINVEAVQSKKMSFLKYCNNKVNFKRLRVPGYTHKLIDVIWSHLFWHYWYNCPLKLFFNCYFVSTVSHSYLKQINFRSKNNLILMIFFVRAKLIFLKRKHKHKTLIFSHFMKIEIFYCRNLFFNN
jgi:hypothetical protein